ncbi:hypothetical protein B0A53_04080 [Rhodotorula sp. CCFEE 5036]|nr:hypothetical protein B0A53_04080 [Rhodotorula sp. CCFEE 5036]
MQSDDRAYHQAKIAFVSDLEGGSVSHINLVCATALSTYALWIIVNDRWLRTRRRDSLWIPWTEGTILILPLLLALTTLSGHPVLLNVLIGCITLLCARQPRPPSPPPLSPVLEKRPPAHAHRISSSSGLFVQPFVTSYRAIMMVMTVLCILAVDFPAFPREFAKAETWGTSLMDLGVGSFVFSLGLVSALPLLRQSLSLPSPPPHLAAADYSSNPPPGVSTRRNGPNAPPPPGSYRTTISTSVRKSLPVIALGMIRVIMVKGVEYPEHVTEYGVHWNFFFTLAFLPVLGAGIERYFFAQATRVTPAPESEHHSPRVMKLDMHAMGLGIGVVHQLLLSLTPLQEWALTAERTNLLSQNKEGLVSLPGYLSIYLLGLATGLYTLPPSPTFFRTMTSRLDPASTPIELIRQLERKKREKGLGYSSGGGGGGGGRTLRRGGDDDNYNDNDNNNLEEEEREKRQRVNKKNRDKGARKKAEWLASAAVCWWILYGLVVVTFGGGGDTPRVSRRLANLPYVVWVAAFNTTFLGLYLILHLVLDPSGGEEEGEAKAPAIFEAINRNGLVVFLVANLMTGLINVTLETMYASDFVAVVVLSGYAASLVGCAWAFRTKRVVKLS